MNLKIQRPNFQFDVFEDVTVTDIIVILNDLHMSERTLLGNPVEEDEFESIHILATNPLIIQEK